MSSESSVIQTIESSEMSENNKRNRVESETIENSDDTSIDENSVSDDTSIDENSVSDDASIEDVIMSEESDDASVEDVIGSDESDEVVIIEKVEKKRRKKKKEDKGIFSELRLDDHEDYQIHITEKLRKPKVPVFVQWKKICYDVKTKNGVKRILDNISGKVVPGEFLAVMGPTGSGKTTLLTILSDRVKKGVAGEILINGAAPSVNYKRQVGYIQQDDLLFKNLTVQQTLDFTADMTLPDDMSAEDRRVAVSEMIEILNLGNCKDTVIGAYGLRGVSGGERKRVNIGNQLLKKPAFIILDEPTSGLDASTALNLIKLLKAMCSVGMTVIASIHQPSSQIFELFDKLLLMVDGRSIYYGPTLESVDYFGKLGLKMEKFYNPADFMMGLILKEEISNKKGKSLKKQMMAEYKKRIGYNVYKIEDKKEKKVFEKCVKAQNKNISTTAEYPSGFGRQFSTLYKRSFFDYIKIYLTPLNLFQITAIALCVGILWFRRPFEEAYLADIIGALFFISVFSSGFFSAFIALLQFPVERIIITREREDGMYRLSTYFVAKMIAEVPFTMIFPLLFGIIAYILVGFRFEFASIVGFHATLMVGGLCSAGFGTMISAGVRDPPKAPVIASVFLIFFMVAGGFYVDFTQVTPYLSWIAYVSFLKYIFSGTLDSQFIGLEIPQDLNVTSVYDDYANIIPGEAITASRFSQLGGAGWNILALIGISFLFRLIAFIILSFSIKPKK